MRTCLRSRTASGALMLNSIRDIPLSRLLLDAVFKIDVWGALFAGLFALLVCFEAGEGFVA